MLAMLAGFAITLLALTGCSLLYREIDTMVDPTGVSLREGETPYGTVLHQLGPPAKVSALAEGFVFLYEDIESAEEQIGIGLGIEAVPWLKLFKFSAARADADHEILLLIFDDEGILQSQCHNERKEDLGTGTGIQYVLAVESLVDTSHLEDEIGPDQWGKSLLRPLAHTLNLNQSLDTGVSGLEQEGTPTNVGQHTLEMRRIGQRNQGVGFGF